MTAPADGDIRAFLTVLRRCQKQPGGDLEFDPARRTLTLPRLELAGLDDGELATFKVLTHLHGDLVLKGNRKLSNLDGLRNLETVHGRLEISGCALPQLSGLTRLHHAGGVIIEGMDQLASISGFTSLQSCADGLRLRNNPKLARISGFTRLRRIDNGVLNVQNCPALVSVCGLTALIFASRGILFADCPELADFRFLGGLESIPAIEVSNSGLTDGSPLHHLFACNPHWKGTIKFSRNRNLTDLSFLAGLASVGSSLYLDHNRLTDLRGLENLRRVGASCNLSGNGLKDISQLARLEEVNGVLLLSGNRLSSLHGLENLRRIRSKEWGKDLVSIRLNDNRDEHDRPCLADISALANLQEVTGRLVVHTDKDQCYRIRPGEDSVFYARNASFQVFGPTRATRLPLTHIIDLPKREPVPLLFPDMSKAWQDNLQTCPGIVPHFLPFTSVAEVVACCRVHRISTVVGIKLSSQKFLAAHGAEVRRHGLRFIDNDLRTLDNCENKHHFKQVMDQSGFGKYVPVYYDRPDSVRYPCIVKPHHGSFGSGQRIVSSPQGLGRPGKDEVVCEFIAGPVEYATHCFFLNRDTCRHVTYRKTYNSPYFILGTEDKSNLLYETVDTPYPELLLNILENIGFRGICCIDYKPSPTGPKIFEINARIGFTLSAHPHDLQQMLDLYLAHAQ